MFTITNTTFVIPIKTLVPAGLGVMGFLGLIGCGIGIMSVLLTEKAMSLKCKIFLITLCVVGMLIFTLTLILSMTIKIK